MIGMNILWKKKTKPTISLDGGKKTAYESFTTKLTLMYS